MTSMAVLRRVVSLVLVCLAGVGCGEKTPETPPAAVSIVEIFPADGQANVSVAARVQATIARADAATCRFSTDNTTLTVTQNGTEVVGATVVFVDGLRMDFTPSGLFEPSTTYTVRVALSCTEPIEATFTTSGPQTAPGLLVGDAFKTIDLAVSEPSALASVLQDFLGDANIVFQVLGLGTDELRVLAGEGDDFPLAPVGLLVFRRNSFYFPMTGVYEPPYFQIEGRLTIPVNNSEIILERFEISGRFFGTSPTVEIVEGNIRASSPCDTICLVDDPEIQLICGNRSSICDGNDNLNLVGVFNGAPNAVGDWQTISVTPADGATSVAVGSSIDVTLSQQVENANKAVVIEVFADGSTTALPGTTTVDVGGLSASFVPTAQLSANTTYRVRVVAHAALDTSFSTVP